ncbi:HdeD family acid-resistance protein [Nocardiopsis lambiniae]|uniref:HdeD family acid-resistance protein n=1 Tax=Nocardiopsis lambiniae TaxID=3075539 RepID=A0ABU2M388_9ACTN|nr:HdeD family acid-resistance protein [Nocardiopsis sp. DSM 44743]MDT0327092.1 HdeD family acid-resistance protein [Nocardiopsis sp. DSM 44743]
MMRNMLAGEVLGDMSRNWWMVVLRGVAAVLFGLIALIWPGLTLVALAVVFGVYALIDAAVLGYAAYQAASGTRASLVAQAVLSGLVGLIALIWPVAAVIALVFVIGLWAIITGVAEIVTAVRLRAHISSEWLLIFAGALSIVFGLLLWFWPLVGAQAIVFVVGVYAVIFGVVMIVAGFRLRGASDAIATARNMAAADMSEMPERPVSAFDEGYSEGYREGYRGDPNVPRDQATEGTDDASAARRTGGGRHRSPEEPGDGSTET